MDPSCSISLNSLFFDGACSSSWSLRVRMPLDKVKSVYHVKGVRDVIRHYVGHKFVQEHQQIALHPLAS